MWKTFNSASKPHKISTGWRVVSSEQEDLTDGTGRSFQKISTFYFDENFKFINKVYHGDLPTLYLQYAIRFIYIIYYYNRYWNADNNR